MMYKFRFLFCSICILTGFLVAGCTEIKNEKGEPLLDPKAVSNLLDAAEDFTIEAQELAKPKQIEAWVDQLIVTAQPGTDMPEVAKLREGEKAEYLYQRTVRKARRNLRNQEYFDRYILIKTKEGIMGWVHEGGVKFIRPDFQNMLDELGLSPTSSPNARTRGPSPNTLSPSQDFLVVPGSRVGPIKLKTTEQELMSMYGPGQIGRGTVTNADKTEEPCTVLMEGTNNEVRISWKDNERTRIKAVYLMRPNSRWFTKEGLTTGLSLTELTKVNESPLTFYGFNWDYSGTVSSWRGGVLGKYEKYFYAVLNPSIPANVKLPEKYTGNHIISSNEEGISALNIVIDKLVIYLD